MGYTRSSTKMMNDIALTEQMLAAVVEQQTAYKQHNRAAEGPRRGIARISQYATSQHTSA